MSHVDEKKHKEIIKKFITILSYYNELGDNLFEQIIGLNDIFKNENEKKKKEEKYGINILCIGKSQRGKSRFINYLLKEKRAKEGGSGKSCTTKILKYKVDNVPLNIFDTIGFTNDINSDIINELKEKINELQNRIKNEGLHLILYFIDYNDDKVFDPKEIEIFKIFCNSNTIVQYLFVCTKFCEIQKNKKRSLKKINELIQNHMKKVKTSLNDLCSQVIVKIKPLVYDEDEIKDDNVVGNDENSIRKKNKEIKMTIIDYLYCCQKRENILEFDNKIIDENTKLSTIINLKNIVYLNTIKCIKNGNIYDIYGIKDMCDNIISLLKFSENKNKKIYYKIIKEEGINYDMKILPNNILPQEEDSKLLNNNKNERIRINEIEEILKSLEKKAIDCSLKYKVEAGAAGIIP